MNVSREASDTPGLFGYLVHAIPNPGWFVAQVVATVLLAGVTATLLRRRYFSPISHVPGPFLASISRLWHLLQILQGKQNLNLVKLHEKLGHFVRIAHNEVSVSHPGAAKALYLTATAKGDWYSIFAFPDWRYPTAISIQNPRRKAEYAKYLSNAALSLQNVIQYEGIVNDQITKLLGWMDHYSRAGTPMELDRFFAFVAFDIIGELTFSKPFGFIEKGGDISKAIEQNDTLNLYVTVFGHYRWASFLFMNPLINWFQMQSVNHTSEVAFTSIKERSKNPDARFDSYSYWHRGLEKAKRDRYANFTERGIVSAAVAYIGAGSSTVASGMSSVIYHLLRDPARWREIRDDIDAARANDRCQSQVVSYEDASKLPRLDAAIKESLRIFPPICLGLPRLAPPGGITIGDETFPEGVTLSVNPAVLHLSKEIWGPDAEEFNPDRWHSPDIAFKEKFFMPWGMGWASCPGQQLAKFEMLKILATIIRDYDIQLVNPEQEWKWKAYFAVVPKEWPVRLVKRQL